jgi:hypothetical protein
MPMCSYGLIYIEYCCVCPLIEKMFLLSGSHMPKVEYVYYVGADVSPETCEIQHNMKQKKKCLRDALNKNYRKGKNVTRSKRN